MCTSTAFDATTAPKAMDILAEKSSGVAIFCGAALFL